LRAMVRDDLMKVDGLLIRHPRQQGYDDGTFQISQLAGARRVSELFGVCGFTASQQIADYRYRSCFGGYIDFDRLCTILPVAASRRTGSLPAPATAPQHPGQARARPGTHAGLSAAEAAGGAKQCVGAEAAMKRAAMLGGGRARSRAYLLKSLPPFGLGPCSACGVGPSSCSSSQRFISPSL
jgi:hypothetical protein